MYVQLDKSNNDIPPPLQLLLVQNIRKSNNRTAFSQCKNNHEKDTIKMRLITTFTLKGESLYCWPLENERLHFKQRYQACGLEK